jgi:hypothetical protein
MFLTVDTSIRIRAAPEAIWDYASRPENWTASNPTEHFGLQFDSPDNLPHAGVTFTQQESVAGVRAVLRGRFHYMDRPHLAFWTGIASYRLLGGLLTVRLPEGGVLSVIEDRDSVRLVHNVYIHFPDSLWGKVCLWFFEKVYSGGQAVHDHTFRELRYFKERLEAAADAQ